MQFKSYYLLVILTVLIGSYTNAQSIAWGTCTGDDLQVLYSDGTVTFEFTNESAALSNATFEVQLGTGVEYIAGNLVYTTSGSATVIENASTGDNLAVFTIGALAANENVELTFPRKASCAARAHKIASGSFEDVGHVYEGGTEVSYVNNGGVAYEVIYDMIYANVVLSSPTHTPSSATSVGGRVTRSVNITSGNFGTMDQLWYQDDYEAGNASLSNFEINGTAIDVSKIDDSGGVVTITFDATNLDAVDGSLGTIGDGDVLFEKDEFFTLTYDVMLLQCGSGSILSDIDAFYGPDVNTPCDPSGSNGTSISVTNGTPSVAITGVANPGIDLCGSTTHIVRMTNNASDPEDFAKDVVIFIGLRSNNSAISTLANVTMWGTAYRGVKNFSNFTLNDSTITPGSIAGIYSTNIDYIPSDYFVSDPDGPGVGLDDLDGDGFYDDLGPGKFVDVGFDMTLTPEDNTCSTGREDYIHWEHISVDAEWSNQCGDNQAPQRKEINYTNIIRNYNNATFVEGPSDINNGDLFEVRINPHLHSTVLCNGNNGLTGADVTWTVKCILPAGVSLQAGASTDAHHSTYNPSIYQSNDTVFYEINRYNRDWFTFPLEMDCALWDNSRPIAFDFVTTYECGSCWEEDMHCETFYSVPHCPGPCTGIVTTDFFAQRTTPGWTDATKATPVVLTPGVHGTDKMLPFDTMQMIANGYISDTISDNLHLRITYTPDLGGNIFDYIDGEITLYDLDGAHGAIAHTFPITTAPSIDTIINSGSDTYNWDFDLSSFITDIDPTYILGEGLEADSFVVTLNGVYNSNPGYSFYKVNTFRANFYMIDINMEENSCDSYGTPMFYTGFSGNTGGNVINVDGCGEAEMYGYFTWYNLTGDIFPDEYRPIQQIDSIIVKIPDGFKFLGETSAGSIAGTTGHYVKANGDVVVFPTGSYTPNDWSSTQSPRMDVHIKADCSLESGTHYSHLEVYRTIYNYHPNTALHVQDYGVEPIEPRISYVRPSVNATPLNQVQNGIVDSVEWDIQVCNATAGLDVQYNWVVLDNATSTGITVRRVLDAMGDEIVTTDFGGGKIFVPLGSVDGGDCTDFTVVADYTSCAPDDLVVDFGWDCDAYPASAAELPDCGDPTFVRVIPLEASIAAAITNLSATPANPMAPAAGNYGSSTIDMCTDFPVEYRIISSANASMYDINFDILIPNGGSGLVYVPNSATIEVEGVDALNTPRLIDAAGEAALVAGTSGSFNLALSDMDATNFGASQGLTGAGTNPTKNEIIIRFKMQSTCNFTSGRRLKVQTYGSSACGADASGNGELIKSSSLAVSGISVPYVSSFSSSISPNSTFNGCNDTKTLNVDVNIIGGPTSSSDSLFVTLYKGLEYNGSFVCTSMECPTFEGTRMENGNQVVLFKYPTGISDEMISISFEIGSDENKMCGDIAYELSAQAEIAGLFCSASGTTCPMTTVETGVSSGIVNMVKPELEVTFNSLVKTIGTPNQFDFDITVDNNGALTTADMVTVTFYAYDGVNDTIMGPILGSTTATAVIASNGSEQITGFFATSAEAADGVVAVIDRTAAENCSCPEPLDIDDNPTDIRAFALPIELSYFKGIANGCSVELQWETAVEVDNAQFLVEYSENGIDFNLFGVVDAKGTNNGSQAYSFTHDGLLENQYYYRLVQIDFDGREKRFPVISVNSQCREEREIIVYPNPIRKDNSHLTLRYFTQQRNVEIQIIDLLGNVVKQVLLDVDRGFNTSKIDIQELTSGTYLIKEKESSMTKRFVILE